MQFCIKVVTKVKAIVIFIVVLIEWVIETVCESVTTVLHYSKKVCDRVCRWLGPFSFFCDWICKVIKWTETAVDWVCKKVLVAVVLGILKVVIEYVFFIVNWICWIVDWIFFRWFVFLLCHLGDKDQRYIHVCVKILEADRENPSWELTKVERLLQETASRFEQCDLTLCVTDIQIILTEEHRRNLKCGVKGFFSSDHIWFSTHECPPIRGVLPITIFFVDELNKKGCAIPGTNYILVEHSATNATVAHEIGHLCALTHAENPHNVMVNPTTNASVEFTKNQCCMIRTSKYASRTGCGELAIIPLIA